MATSTKHSGFKRLLDRSLSATLSNSFSTTDSELGLLVNGQEAMAFKPDSVGTYGLTKIGNQPAEALASVIDGYGVSLATGYSASATNRIYAVEINADTGSTDLTGDTNVGALKARSVIGTTQTNCGISAITGTTDVGTVNLISNYQGISAVLDFYGNCTITGSVSHLAALSGVVWNEATTTLNSAGGCVAGLDLIQNSGSPTLTAGTNPAINIRASASSLWQYAMYAVNVDKGLYLYTTSASPTATDGLAAYLDTTISGTVAGLTRGVGIWTNLATGAVWSGYAHFVLDVGFYHGSNDMAGDLYLLNLSYQCNSSSTPGTVAMIRANCEVTEPPDYFILFENDEAGAITRSDPGTTFEAYIKVRGNEDSRDYAIPLVLL